MKLLFASNNPDKISEVKEILRDLPIDLITLQDINIDVKIIEDGSTFEANARKKATTIFELTKIPTIADDSGLEVEILEGKPGINSSNYSGEEHNYDKNNAKLLEELIRKPKPHRARFVCVINLKSEDDDEIFFGECKGEIVDEPRGKNGFGYDPLFKPDEYDLTFAELPIEVKNKISHRYNALEKLKEYLISKNKLSS